MEKKMPTTLAIQGKVINVEKIGEKTVAQFGAQLKRNGIELEADKLEALYKQLTGTEDQDPEVERIKAEAEARAAKIKAEAEAKAKAKFNL